MLIFDAFFSIIISLAGTTVARHSLSNKLGTPMDFYQLCPKLPVPIKAGRSVLIFGAGSRSMWILQCVVAKPLDAELIVVVDCNLACNEVFATSGHVLSRNPQLVTPEDSLKIAKESATEIHIRGKNERKTSTV